MADDFILKFLIRTLDDPAGRKSWLERKLRLPLVDLANADFTDRDLRDYDFSEANLSTAICLGADLSGADFSDADLSLADLRRATMRNCLLDRANLSSANLQEALLTDACLEGANLSGARMAGVDLIGADLSDADLTGADLRGACLKYTRMTGTKLHGANVAEADLTGAVMDDDAPMHLENFELALIDDRRYRVMKSRLGASPSTELIPAERREPPAEKPAKPAKKPKDDSQRRRRRGLLARAVKPEEGPEVVSFEATEADLETEEGCYRVLGIETGTPLAGITRAFRAKAKLYHPDRVQHLDADRQEAAGAQFRICRQAYEKLSALKTKPLVHVIWPEDLPRRASPYEYTLAEYERLAELNPDNADVLYNLGWKYFDAGRLDQAIEAYERVLHIHPRDDDAEYNLRVIRLCQTFDLSPNRALNGY